MKNTGGRHAGSITAAQFLYPGRIGIAAHAHRKMRRSAVVQGLLRNPAKRFHRSRGRCGIPGKDEGNKVGNGLSRGDNILDMPTA